MSRWGRMGGLAGRAKNQRLPGFVDGIDVISRVASGLEIQSIIFLRNVVNTLAHYMD